MGALCVARISRDHGVSCIRRVLPGLSPSLLVAVLSGHSLSFPGVSPAAEGKLGVGGRITGFALGTYTA